MQEKSFPTGSSWKVDSLANGNIQLTVNANNDKVTFTFDGAILLTKILTEAIKYIRKEQDKQLKALIETQENSKNVFDDSCKLLDRFAKLGKE